MFRTGAVSIVQEDEIVLRRATFHDFVKGIPMRNHSGQAKRRGISDVLKENDPVGRKVQGEDMIVIKKQSALKLSLWLLERANTKLGLHKESGDDWISAILSYALNSWDEGREAKSWQIKPSHETS